MSGVSMYRMVGVGDREGDWWLPAGGIRASQGTFSSLFLLQSHYLAIAWALSSRYKVLNTAHILAHYFKNSKIIQNKNICKIKVTQNFPNLLY